MSEYEGGREVFKGVRFIGEETTMREISDYFCVTKKTVETIIIRYRGIFDQHIRIVRGNELKMLKVKHKDIIPMKAQTITLVDKKCMYMIAMYLTESENAEKLKSYLFNNEPELYAKFTRHNLMRFKFYEAEIYDYLRFSFGEDNVRKQVKCGKYKLDFVLFDSIHIEVDENGHESYDKLKEKEREDYIYSKTKYKTIRYNPQKEMPYALMGKILNHLNYAS